ARSQLVGWQWDRALDSLYLTGEPTRTPGAEGPPAGMDDVLACLRESDRRHLAGTLAAICEGTGFDLELQGAQADGTPFWVRMIGQPDPHDPGSERFSGTLQDISDRKRAEESLRSEEHTSE